MTEHEQGRRSRSRRGPRPAGRRPALSDARRRVLDAVARLGAAADAAPVTLADVAGALGGHPNASRQQLDALAAEGLLAAAPVARPGRGRRPLGYTLTERGRRALGGEPGASELRGIVDAFATYLVRDGRTDDARKVGRVWAETAGAGIAADSGLAGLVEVLDALGFDPVPARSGDDAALILRTCPLLELAEGHPEVICQVHAGMIDGVLRRAGAAEGLRLVPFADDEGCRIMPDSVPPSAA